VLSDGDGNPRGYFDNTGNFTVPSAATNGTITVSGSTRGILELRGNFGGSTDICQIIANNANNSTVGRFRWINTTGGATDTAALWTMATTSGVQTTATITNAYGLGLGQNNPPSSGLGIAFPATQSASSNANTLDDYEEGTWTPVVRGAVTAGTYELAIATGVYTKVGNLVTVTCRIVAAAVVTGGGTTYLQITGLPFENTSPANGAVSMSGLDMTTNYTWLTAAPIAASGTAVWYLEECGDSQNTSDFPISGFGVNDTIRFTATYYS